MEVTTTTNLPTSYIYYAFRPDNFDEKYYKETSVIDDTVYPKNIIVQCTVTKPYTLMEICIVDDIQNEYLLLSSIV